MTDLSMPVRQGDTTLPDPVELPAAITAARRMLATFSAVDHGDRAAVDLAHNALAESMRLLLRAIDRTAEQQRYATAQAAEQPAPAGQPPAECTATATSCIEGYSPRDGRAHGSLDTTTYTCAAHAPATRAEVEAAGLTAYTCETSGLFTCGERFDFRTLGGGQ